MGLIREPQDVDFYIQSRPLTEEDHKEILEFIKKRKAANLAKEKRRTQRKKTKITKAL
jgi:hypothetical protein